MKNQTVGVKEINMEKKKEVLRRNISTQRYEWKLETLGKVPNGLHEKKMNHEKNEVFDDNFVFTYD